MQWYILIYKGVTVIQLCYVADNELERYSCRLSLYPRLSSRLHNYYCKLLAHLNICLLLYITLNIFLMVIYRMLYQSKVLDIYIFNGEQYFHVLCQENIVQIAHFRYIIVVIPQLYRDPFQRQNSVLFIIIFA